MKTFLFILLFFILPLRALLAAPDEIIKMQLSWKHQFQFAGYYAAVEKGFYKENKLNVRLVEGGPGVSCNQDMLEREAHYCNAPSSMVKKYLEGEEVVALASFLQYSPAVLLTLKGSGLLKPKDLIGKRVETMLAGVAIPEIKALFQSQSITLDQLDNKENSVGVDALVKRRVDAKYAFSTSEPYQLEALGVEYNVIDLNRYGINLYGDSLFTSEQERVNNPKRVEGFLQASIKGWIYAMENQSEIAKLILAKYSTLKSYDELMAEANAIEKLMLRDVIEVGHVNEARWRSTARVLMSRGIVEDDFVLDGFIYQPVESDDEWLLKLLGSCLFVVLMVAVTLWAINRAMSAEIKARIEAQNLLSATNRLIRKQAYTDELSGLDNRRSFYEQGEAQLSLAQLNKAPLAIVSIDVDHFKGINDNYGHATGDLVIQRLGELILRNVRANDIQGRIGGEEFAIMTPETGSEGAEELAERIRAQVESIDLVVGENTIRLTVSIGIAVYKLESDNLHSMMARADRALYEAKDLGRNQVVISTDTSDDSFIIKPNQN